ncbi:MAG TPA: hypothetical protein VIC08_00810 [Cellvibrionaceae bacterium]
MIKTKKQVRQELEMAMRDYLDRGGYVNQVASGISGREDHNRPLPHVFDKKSETETRTPLSELVAVIDQRRKPAPLKPRSGTPASKRRPRKKIIYDDFGQPLRWEWDEG